MKPSAVRSAFMLACLPGCVIALALVTGCASESQTTSGSQEMAKAPPTPPKEERVEAPPEPPPPPKQQEMAPEAAAPPVVEDPLAWAADLADAHFGYDQAKVLKADKAGLDALAHKLKEDSKRKVLVEGHCDSRGTARYNMVLGERRAKAVREYLVKAGAADSQIEVVSYGKEKPLCMDMTEECWKSNRRAHFTAQ